MAPGPSVNEIEEVVKDTALSLIGRWGEVVGAGFHRDGVSPEFRPVWILFIDRCQTVRTV